MKKVEEQNRGDAFCRNYATSIWKEVPDEANPFHAQEARCHGYLHQQLINHKSFADVLFLLFRGELPDAQQSSLLEKLLLTLIHPGPRHNACRAAMSAATSRAHVSNILPLALNVLSGEHNGSHEVFRSIKFIQQHSSEAPATVAAQMLEQFNPDSPEDQCAAPGFGSLFGSADTYSQSLADNLISQYESAELQWCQQFLEALAQQSDRPDYFGWRMTGLAAATLTTLGFSPYEGELIYQIASLPGIAAQAAEKSEAPLTAMPFVPEQDYVIE